MYKRQALRSEKGIEVIYDSVSDFVKLNEGVDLERLADKYKDVDLIIYVGGISPMLEGEEGDAGGLEGFVGGDRTTIALPAIQTEVMKRLNLLGKSLIFICMSGGAMSFNWEVDVYKRQDETNGTEALGTTDSRWNDVGGIVLSNV